MKSEFSTAQGAGERESRVKGEKRVTSRVQEGKAGGRGCCTIWFRPDETQSSLGSARGPEKIRDKTVVWLQRTLLAVRRNRTVGRSR